jgi:hypothetical protein
MPEKEPAMKRSILPVALFAVASLLVLTGHLLAADRLSDRNLERLFEQLDDDRDRFEDALDDTLKRSVIGGPAGEVDVSRYLDDFEESISRLRERFKSDYSASPEAYDVLRRGSAVQGFLSRHPGTRGTSEFNRLATGLEQLAASYGVRFPLDESVKGVGRANGLELVRAADDIARASDQFRDAYDDTLEADSAVTMDARQAQVRDAEAIEDAAKAVRSRIDDDKPASAEARQLVDLVDRVGGLASSRTLSPQGRTAWQTISAGVEIIAKAFGLRSSAALAR